MLDLRGTLFPLLEAPSSLEGGENLGRGHSTSLDGLGMYASSSHPSPAKTACDSTSLSPIGSAILFLNGNYMVFAFMGVPASGFPRAHGSVGSCVSSFFAQRLAPLLIVPLFLSLSVVVLSSPPPLAMGR